MSRITSWLFDARAAILLPAFCLLSGCLSDETREDPGRLIVSPAMGYQNDILPLTLSSENLPLNECSNAELRFADDEREAPITVHGIHALLHDESSVRAYITIDAETTPKSYDVIYRCNPKTTLHGTFHVKAIPANIELIIDNPYPQAGRYNWEMKLSTTLPFFTEESYVLFGKGDDVTVTGMTLISPYEMALTVNISPYAATGAMSVTAITGSLVAEGSLTISDRVKSEIFVSPEAVERTPSYESKLSTYELTIRGKDIEFIVPGADAGAVETATQITFPEEPGITVTDYWIEEETLDIVENGEPSTVIEQQIKAKIMVNKLATLGGTALQVTTGDTVAWTNLTILLPPGTPYLRIQNQSPIPRNGKPTLVFAEAINFSFENVLDDTGDSKVRCVEDNCEVINYTVSPEPYRKMDVQIVVGSDFEGNTATLEVETEQGIWVPAVLTIGAAEPITIEADQESLVQGTSRELIRFSLSGDNTFDIETTMVKVLPRSGLNITNFSVDWQGGLIVELKVAPDAPTGPTYIHIVSDEKVYEALLYVLPSGPPSLSVFPGATLKKRDAVRVNLEASGFTLPASIEDYRFDDPSLQVLGVDPRGDEVDLTIEVSPAARTDMSVLYVNGEDGKAAATFRVLKSLPMPVLTATPSMVIRGTPDSPTATTVQISAPGVQFERPTIEVMDGIGLEVVRPLGGDNFVFDLKAHGMDPESGFAYPTGWTGLIVHNKTETYLVGIYVEDSGQNLPRMGSLTAVLSPPAVYPGTRRMTITATLPPQLTLEAGVLHVQSGVDGIYTSSPQIVGEQVTFILDVPFDIEPGNSPVPIFITGAQGAAVGLLDISTVPTNTLSGEWEGLATPGKVVLSVDPTQVPALLTGAMGRPDHAEPKVLLIAENQLDVADSGKNGRIWITRRVEDPAHYQETANIAEVTAEEALKVIVDIRSRGRTAIRESDEDAEGDGWVVLSPCETPFLGVGSIADGLDIDQVFIGESTCRLAAMVLARDLADRPWDTPDLMLEARGPTDELIGSAGGWPTPKDPDPRLYLDAGLEDVTLVLTPELGSAGSYMVHLRSPTVIRELSRSPENPFVEIETEPGTTLAGMRLELFDATNGMLVESLDLSDIPVGDDGIAVISGEDHPAAMLPDQGAFALQVLRGEDIVDAIQVGEGVVNLGEGNPVLLAEDAPFFFRIAGIDTNNNLEDFKADYIGTPGS